MEGILGGKLLELLSKTKERKWHGKSQAKLEPTYLDFLSLPLVFLSENKTISNYDLHREYKIKMELSGVFSEVVVASEAHT